MKQVDTLNALKHLSTVHRQQFDERRQYEWKAFVTVLTFYVLSVSARFGVPSSMPGGLALILVVWTFFLVLAALTILYLRDMQRAGYRNKHVAENAEEAIGRLVNGEKNVKIDVRSGPEKWAKWSWVRQAFTILVFAIYSAILITSESMK